MSTLKATNLQHASAGSPAIVLASSGSATAQLSSVNDGPIAGARNRIINGDMRIDQRNAGASVTASASLYNLDRYQTVVSPNSKFTIQQNAGSVTPPAGFTNYLGVTSSSAYTVASGEYQTLWQRIEGYNCADFAWGTVNAKTVTLSFWVRSSLTGTFGGAVQNSAVDRSYPFSYSITAANTWEYKTVVIPGDTSGTWLTTNGAGITLSFGLGVGSTFTAAAGSWAAGNYISANSTVSVVGTNGATFYITGVQLEPGSVATPFERRSYGQELALCQRYYYKISGADPYGVGHNWASTAGRAFINFKQTMRAAPTALEQSGTASDYNVFVPSGSVTNTSVPAFSDASTEGGRINYYASLTSGDPAIFNGATANAYLAWSAEL